MPRNPTPGAAIQSLPNRSSNSEGIPIPLSSITKTHRPSDGVRVAFIVENGAPIEPLEFTDPNHPGRRQQKPGS